MITTGPCGSFLSACILFWWIFSGKVLLWDIETKAIHIYETLMHGNLPQFALAGQVLFVCFFGFFVSKYKTQWVQRKLSGIG